MSKINEKKIDTTFDEPVSDQAKNFEDKFDREMVKSGLPKSSALIEVDNFLNEKEGSLKKKIFSLAKMESLVHADPKLSAVYDEMAENGEEKYGYHYNETIMNMIFNDYVLNSAKYLQKYKMAVPKKKKRRDKSGINALRKGGEEIEKRREELKKEKEMKKEKEVNESTVASSAGAFFTKAGDKKNYESNKIDTEKEWKKLIDAEISEIGKEKKMKDKGKSKAKVIDKTNIVGGSNAKPTYDGGKFVKNDNNILKESTLEDAKKQAKDVSKEEGVAQHVNKINNDEFEVSDWYDDNNTVASYENGMSLNENVEDVPEEDDCFIQSDGTKYNVSCGGQFIGEYVEMNDALNAIKGWKETNKYYPNCWFVSDHGNLSLIDDQGNILKETTTAASSGAYVGPAAWGSGDLIKKGKSKEKDKQSFWTGGQVIKESNYLTESEGFEKYINSLGENINDMEKISTKEQLKGLGRKLTKEDIPNLAGEALYAVAISLANRMLPLTWDDLPDINSMWDYIDENGGMTFQELKSAVKDAASERMSEEGFGDLFESNATVDRDSIEGFEKLLGVLKTKRAIDFDLVERVAKLNNMEMEDLMHLIGVALYRDENISYPLNEKSKSKAQQRLMGQAYAYKTGEIGDDEASEKIKELAASMSEKDLEDFASTKHNKLPEKVDENPALLGTAVGAAAAGAGKEIGSRVADRIGLEEHHLNTREEKIEFIFKAFDLLLNPQSKKDWLSINSDRIINYDDNQINKLYLSVEDMLKERNIDPMTIVENSMIDSQETSMKIQPPINQQSGDMPIGMQTSSPMNENKQKNMEKDLEKYNKELELFEKYHKNLKEDRKPSSLVMKDRLGDENKKNFKKDLKDSSTKEIIDTTKELEWKDQQEDVGDDPYKMGEEIEKESIKRTKGESFKNVGNSTNKEGDEIPKRNLTDEEANEVDLYRKGLGDVNFDNEPSERYMERMKADMGEEEFKKREQRMDFEADKPMYNKDTQPVEDGIEKDQFDKNKSKWNDRFGTNESYVTGKFRNDLNKNQLIDFKLSEAKEVFTVTTDDWKEVKFEGIGNTYDNNVNVNESVKSAINEFKFYTDGTNVFVKHNSRIISESTEKETIGKITEGMKKINHLLNYNSKDFIDTKKNKL